MKSMKQESLANGESYTLVNNKKGITLVALIVTIVILLILAGISIQGLTGNGLFEKAKQAKQNTINAQERENSILNEYEDKINEIVGSRETVTLTQEEYQIWKNQSSYSTNEKIVGEWDNGKAIYRKTFSDLSISMSTNKWYTLVDVSSLSIDELVNATMYRASDNTIANHCCFNIESGYLKGYITHDPARTWNKIVIEYTKTTN